MSLFASVQTGCLIAFALLLLWAAWQDWRTMQIADGISLGIIAVFAVWAMAGLAAGSFSLLGVGLAVACAVGLFGLGALAFMPAPWAAATSSSRPPPACSRDPL